MTTFLKIAALCAGTLTCGGASGCASIVCGSTQEISVDSIPSGAEIYVDGVPAGETPAKADLPRAQETVLVLKKDGFADTRVKIAKRTNGWWFAECCIPLFGPVFLLIDAANGALIKYAEDDVVAPMLSPEERRISLYGGNVILINEDGK